jgi:hypothetical protein
LSKHSQSLKNIAFINIPKLHCLIYKFYIS